MHLSAAGTHVLSHSTIHKNTSTMLRNMCIATHVVKKWKEVSIASGVVSSYLYQFNATLPCAKVVAIAKKYKVSSLCISSQHASVASYG
jgi:hypothetical protein